MKIDKVKIKDIKSNPNNPRIIKDDKFQKLVKSVKEFPQMMEIRPIVVNEDMMVLGGNMRLKACIEAGYKEVPIIKANDLTEDQQKEFIIKDNVSGGEWDWSMLANEWDTNQLTEWGVDVWQPSDNILLDDFFNTENTTEEKQENNKIILEYTEDDYNEVINLFSKKNGSKEKIVLELLRNT